MTYTDRGPRLGTEGDIEHVGGPAVRERVGLVGRGTTTPTPTSVQVWLPERGHRGAA